jgi:hypothetical protein
MKRRDNALMRAWSRLAKNRPLNHNPKNCSGEIMLAIRSGKFQRATTFAAMIVTIFVMAFTLSLLPTASEAYTPEQQQACTDDAFRLCGPEVPDVDRVTACMVRNKAQLSPGCRVYFRSPESNSGAATPVRAGMPLSIEPGKSRSPAKPRKSTKASED